MKQVQHETYSGLYPMFSMNVILFLSLLGSLFFISLGVWLLIENESHVECKLYYHDTTLQEGGASRYLLRGISSRHCSREVDILSDTQIYVYVEIENLYQDDAQVLWSRHDKQLAGKIYTNAKDLSSCSPLVTAEVDNVTKVLHPCGALAWNVFTDKYQFLEGAPDGDNDQVPLKPISLNQTQAFVLNSLDWRHAYRNPPPEERLQVLDQVYFWMSPADNDDGQDMYKSREEARAELLADRLNYEEAGDMVENAHFIQWMQAAPFSRWRKLYGRLAGPIHLPLSAHITVMYDVSSWKGKKAIILVQKSRFGGETLFIGVAYIVFGSVLTLLAVYVLWKKYQEGSFRKGGKGGGGGVKKEEKINNFSESSSICGGSRKGENTRRERRTNRERKRTAQVRKRSMRRESRVG